MRIFAATSSADWPGRVGRALFLLGAVAPVAWGLGYAVAYSFGLVGLLNHGFTLRHWAALVQGGEMTVALLFSAAVALVTVACTIAVALPLALALRGSLARPPFAALVRVPLALPAAAAALVAWLWLAGAGLFARVAWHLGLLAGPGNWPALVQDRWGVGIALAHTALAVPFFVILFVRLHRDERIDEFTALVRTLGGTPAAARRRVAVPLLLRRAAPQLTLLFTFVFGAFEIPLVLGAQYPQMLSILARRKFGLFDLTQKPEAFVIAVVYAAIVLGVVHLVFRRRAAAHVV